MQYDFFPDSRFQCRCCEFGCCSRFEVSVTPEEREKIEKLGLVGVPPWEQCFLPGRGRDFILAKDPGSGRCVFSDGNRCRIHAGFGYQAKPLSCRVFPLHIQHWQDGHVSVEYRYICPAVGGEAGKTLAENRAAVERLAREMETRRPADKTTYSPENPVGLGAIRQVHAAFSGILHDRKLPFRLRCYAVQRVLDFHRRKALRPAIAAADASFSADAAAFVSKAREELIRELNAGRVDALTRTNFRNILCGYLRDDDPKTAHGIRFRLERTLRQFLIVTGPGLLSDLNPEAPHAPGGLFPPREKNWPGAEMEAWRVFENYFFGKLDSMHFCGGMVHGYTYEEGMRHLLLLPTVAFALASAWAWHDQRREAGAEDMLKTVRLLDFTFARSPFFRLRPARRWIRQLSSPESYAGLLRATLPLDPSAEG